MPSTADTLIRSLELSDHYANTCRPDRGRWMLPLIAALTGGAVVLARRLARTC